jgi:LytR cell envelope-related transcriptional attenuator
VAALSPPDGAPRRPSRFRRRYHVRLRRALPALVLLLALSVLAGGVWLRVLDRVDAGATPAAACGTGSTGALDARRIQIRVYNATAREGLARSVSDQLRSRGLAVIATANDPLIDIRDVRGSAEVRYGPKGAKQAEVVRRQVPGAKMFRDAREDDIVDLALGPAFKRLATPAELAKGRQGLVAPATAAAPPPAC